jgi:hypothetical protein
MFDNLKVLISNLSKESLSVDDSVALFMQAEQNEALISTVSLLRNMRLYIFKRTLRDIVQELEGSPLVDIVREKFVGVFEYNDITYTFISLDEHGIPMFHAVGYHGITRLPHDAIVRRLF